MRSEVLTVKITRLRLLSCGIRRRVIWYVIINIILKHWYFSYANDLVSTFLTNVGSD
jgi:hypothetical protein